LAQSENQNGESKNVIVKPFWHSTSVWQTERQTCGL